MLTKIVEDYNPADEISLKLNKNSIQLKLYYGNQNNFPEDLSIYYPYLSKMEINRSKRFKNKTDERTYVIAHALLNNKISELLEKDFNSIKINYFDNRKPYIEGSTVDFNLSHSSDCFAFAITTLENTFIGVDIEVIKEKTDFEQIVNHYFHENEISHILKNNFSIQIQRKRFYEIWTRKEAFLKMLGIGLSEELSKIDLTPGERNIIIQNKSSFKYNKFSEIYIYTFNLSNGIVLSLSINHPAIVTPELCNR
jgi:phosphopantetheinyl transferase